MLICVVHSQVVGLFVLFGLFVCFCVFVEMSLYAYKSCTFCGGLIDLVACLFVVFVCV